MNLRSFCRSVAIRGLALAIGATFALGAPSAAGELPSAKVFCSYVPASDIAALLGEASFKTSQSGTGEGGSGFSSSIGNSCSFFTTLAKMVSVGVAQFKSDDEAAAFMNDSVATISRAVAVIAEDSVGEEGFYMMLGASIASHYARKGDKVFVTNVISQTGDLQATSTPQRLIAVTRAVVAHF